ncbi:MAG: RHS repeat protein [Acidobacteria bacterium]|nr:RHS repeat protein [Acidobacteriota bacterium]
MPNGRRQTTTHSTEVISVQTPDTAVVRTAYQGNRVMVGDQAGKKRMSETDAAGRLINVWEITSPNPGETQITFTGATSSDLNGTYNANPTAYQYDVLGNLRKVTQAAQMRYFAYDSFSRLIRARNPEQAVNSGIPALTDPVTGNSQWSLAYTYDSNGNLLTKTDPLNITTSYVYDALNRNTQVTYSTYPNGTFYVQRYYDGAVNGKGRAWYEVANNYRWEKPTDNLAYHYSIVNNYDAVGRPLDLVRNFLVLEGGAWQWKSYGLSRS